MSTITRAFTTRRVKQSLMFGNDDSMPQRSNTTKGTTGSIRNKISAPMELIHTTNMLSYNAPDIYPKTASSTSSSHRSDDELSDSAPTTASSPPTSPDVESLPKTSQFPEPNHLSCYFTVPGQQQQPVEQARQAEPPIVPQRAASHTKKSYDSLVHKRSISRMSEQSQRSLSTKASLTFSRSSSTSTNTTATSQGAGPAQHQAKMSGSYAPPPHRSHSTNSSQSPVVHSPVSHRKDFSQSQHPFGQELAQVSEIAEEYGVKEKLNEIDAEGQELVAKGLYKFSAEDYLSEIQGLFTSLFGEPKPLVATVWI